MAASEPDPAALVTGGLHARAPWAPILVIAALGVALRAGLLALALPIEVQSDEANYLYLALGLERFGIYFDQHRYLWPPGYAWLLHRVVGDGSGADLTAFRGIQVAASSVVGITTMLFAWRLFSSRAAVVAGLLWCVHLPLAAFTHLLWSETFFLALFLPALWHVLTALDRTAEGDEKRAARRLLVAGLLLGAALHLKEMPLFLMIPLALLVAWRAAPMGRGVTLRLATLLPLAAVVVLLPWTTRNHEVYGRVTLSGATLGENVYQGLNARYVNFDLVPLARERARRGLAPLSEIERRAFTVPPTAADGEPDPGWERAASTFHPIDRQAENVRRGARWSVEHPGWFARTRLKKWSDLVTPFSFFARHQALGHYAPESGLGGAWRRPLVIWSLLSSVVALIGAALGGATSLGAGHGRSLLAVTIGYVLSAALLVSMSRFRVPIEPLLLVLCAGFLAHGPAHRSAPRLAAGGVAVLGLVGLWWISWPETRAAAAMALEVSR